MKIIGVTYYDGNPNVVLKSDSSLLVNRKPFFVPENVHDLQFLPCVVLRVSRLGKCIADKFASRYYDALAPGLDFFAADLLREAKANGQPWTQAIAFENALAVGEWAAPECWTNAYEWSVQRGENISTLDSRLLTLDSRLSTLDSAVARVSELLTIRQGDLIFVSAQQTPVPLQAEDIVRCGSNQVEQLYCKIK